MGLIPMCVSSNYTTHIHHTTYTHNHVEREKKRRKRKGRRRKERLENQITKSREAIESFNKLREVRI